MAKGERCPRRRGSTAAAIAAFAASVLEPGRAGAQGGGASAVGDYNIVLNGSGGATIEQNITHKKIVINNVHGASPREIKELVDFATKEQRLSFDEAAQRLDDATATLSAAKQRFDEYVGANEENAELLRAILGRLASVVPPDSETMRRVERAKRVEERRGRQRQFGARFAFEFSRRGLTRHREGAFGALSLPPFRVASTECTLGGAFEVGALSSDAVRRVEDPFGGELERQPSRAQAFYFEPAALARWNVVGDFQADARLAARWVVHEERPAFELGLTLGAGYLLLDRMLLGLSFSLSRSSNVNFDRTRYTGVGAESNSRSEPGYWWGGGPHAAIVF
ncbi:MAG TPA: hypothetical protein VFS43_00495 [Polyangiaceae bacterium]|nr:hypothetical protein [Polyangiaceae bacterium]